MCKLHGNMDIPRGSLLQGTIYGYQETNVGGNLLLSLFYASSGVKDMRTRGKYTWKLVPTVFGIGMAKEELIDYLGTIA